ncbi:hypothetical protein BJ944DRAFT_280865 [Cunninghamella echinulata]|nr:hypothetical protein BJ944DRAFT_280865 [Cunninghamella echinulata]
MNNNNKNKTFNLERILQQYASQPDLLELILSSKVEEDRRRAEEAKLKNKEIDYLIQQQQLEQNENDTKCQTWPPPSPPNEKHPNMITPSSSSSSSSITSTSSSSMISKSNKRRRREMQPVTAIIETREFPYNDNYLWRNNGNTIHKKTGYKSIYYKCANSHQNCPVNKTTLFKGNGEYLIKYRGHHLPDCSTIKRINEI